MDKKDAYIWYSGATDVTGKKLQAALEIEGGRDKPKGKKIVIGWGAKTKKDTTFPAGTTVLNHPNNIRRNRNKLGTLDTLLAAKCSVESFVPAEKIMAELDKKNGKIALPLVGRTKYHQGGKGFWTCLTKHHVKVAIDEGAQYFQNYIDIKDEFRLHIFKGDLIRAQKKVKRDNMAEAFVEQHAAKVQDYANKNDVKLDKKTMDYVLGKLANEHPNADMIVRSNKKGWKFVGLKQPAAGLVKVACDALDAIGLQFGAVDCCTDTEGKHWIIEVNSGPGLEGKTFDGYVAKFKDTLADLMKPPKKVVKQVQAAAVGGAPKKAPAAEKSKLGAKTAKERLSGMRELLELVEGADEAEAMAVENLLKKKLGA